MLTCFISLGKQRREKYTTQSLDRALFSKRRKVTSATGLNLQQSEQDVEVSFSGKQNTFPRQNMIFHGTIISSDDNDSEICEKEFSTDRDFQIQEDSRRIYTPTSMLEKNENVITTKSLPGIVRIDMEDSLRSSLQRQSSVQFVTEEDVELTESSQTHQQNDVRDPIKITKEAHTYEETSQGE